MELAIGSAIARLRKARGVTQAQLAEAVGVSVAAVSKWETGVSLS
nr:helix-turn-helix domain-containing protein [Maliibacterium massiliense]